MCHDCYIQNSCKAFFQLAANTFKEGRAGREWVEKNSYTTEIKNDAKGMQLTWHTKSNDEYGMQHYSGASLCIFFLVSTKLSMAISTANFSIGHFQHINF